ncbi:HD domain-containing protein [Burkholderia gladioli]|uniref:HD domain-containing protein n=1 Tax=Burkholderia gladioli TaxID=28095 RepID=UPI001FC82300|nr:HD domain-containing protein [Burkholderia gladioli]
MQTASDLPQPTYTTMAESTLSDVERIVQGLNHYTDPEYLTNLYSNFLVQLRHSTEGFPIDRLEHSLQSASLALRDGRDHEYVVCALLHDVGELFDPFSHDAVIASLLKNYISPATTLSCNTTPHSRATTTGTRSVSTRIRERNSSKVRTTTMPSSSSISTTTRPSTLHTKASRWKRSNR